MRSLLKTLAVTALLVPSLVACGPGDNSNGAGIAPADDTSSLDNPPDMPNSGSTNSDSAPVLVDPGDLPPVPDALADAFIVSDDDKFVTAAEIQMALDANMPLQFIDARPPLDYESGHIPGAINVVYSEASQFDATTLPTDRWMVAYCECPYAEASQTYEALRAQGVNNIRILEEGLAGWRDVLGYELERSTASSEG